MPRERELPFSDPHIDYREAKIRRNAPNVRTYVTPQIDRLWDINKPESLIEALMVQSPSDPIHTSYEMQPIIESVSACVDALNDEHRFVIEAIFYERAAYSELGQRLGCSKTHAWRITQAAMRELGKLLAQHPTIRSRYMRANTWEEAATEWVLSFSLGQTEPYPIDIDDCLRLRDMAVRAHENSGKVGPMGVFKGIAYGAIGQLREMNAWGSKEMANLLISKQQDYGHGNINAFGIYGVLVRLSDKIERLKNLMSNELKPANESLVDTLQDMVGYCVIAMMLDEQTFDLQLGEKNV
jgi:hypothetical protein